MGTGIDDFWPLVRFEEKDRERLAICLHRLLPHLRAGEYALTGGVAIEAHCAIHGLPTSRNTLADLDFIAASMDTVRPTIADEFLIIHFHRPQPDYPKFLVQVVDPISRIRIDIFPDRFGSMQNGICFNEFRLIRADDLLDHKLDVLSSASTQNQVDRKHYLDAVVLADICGRARPTINDSCLGRDEYSLDPDSGCWKCEASIDQRFPLASKLEILEILGYV